MPAAMDRASPFLAAMSHEAVSPRNPLVPPNAGPVGVPSGASAGPGAPATAATPPPPADEGHVATAGPAYGMAAALAAGFGGARDPQAAHAAHVRRQTKSLELIRLRHFSVAEVTHTTSGFWQLSLSTWFAFDAGQIVLIMFTLIFRGNLDLMSVSLYVYWLIGSWVHVGVPVSTAARVHTSSHGILSELLSPRMQADMRSSVPFKLDVLMIQSLLDHQPVGFKVGYTLCTTELVGGFVSLVITYFVLISTL